MNSSNEKELNIRVLIVDLSRRFGGASTRAITLAQQLGSSVAVIAGLEDSPVIQISRERDIPVRIVGKSRSDPLIPWRLAAIIKNGHFNVIDTQNIQSKFWGSIAALLADVVFVSTLNSSYENEQGSSWKGRLYNQLDLWTNWKTRRYIAVSGDIKQHLIESGISENKIDLIFNAVELDKTSIANDPLLVRNQIGIARDAILFIAVGRLVWAKGYEDFVRAFAFVAAQISNAFAVIVGEGELYSKLTDQIREAGLEKRILLLGFRNHAEVINLLASSDIYVMPSRSEGIPYALLEAAAIGLPIVATRCGGIPDVVKDKESALLVPVGDSESLASALIYLAENKLFAKELGENAREKIEHNHKLSVQTKSVMCAYKRAVEDKKK